MYGIPDFNRSDIQDRLKGVIEDLEGAYGDLPDTIGCMESISSKDSCEAWCCREQNPSVWFVEFLNTLENYIFKMDVDDFSSLIKLCLKKYLLIDKSNGCVFWNADTRKCKTHTTRPVNCYFYGVTPDEEFQPRYERLKVLNNNVKPQCDLIKLKNGNKFLTKKEIDFSFDSIRELEKKIGVPDHFLNDNPGGSYRSFHEHALIWILGEKEMCDLSIVRSSYSMIQKKQLINNICDCLRESFSNVK